VREAERDSPLDLWLLLDATASMRQADLARPDLAKFDAARSLAACVIDIALRQGDRFGIVTIAGSTPLALPLGSGARHRDRCLLELARVQPAGAWPQGSALHATGARIASHALVLTISDFDESAFDFARRLAGAGREVLTLQMLAADDATFRSRADGDSSIQNRTRSAASKLRPCADFIARFAAARAALANDCAALGIRHAQYVLDEALDAPLRRLFSAPGARA
jgi:uncharacterized protein (DUF58 family)